MNAGAITLLFTDIEGSTRLWELEPDRMRSALARHNELARAAVEEHRGTMVKTTGDGIYAVFDVPADAVGATLQLQLALADLSATGGVDLRVRCGLHLGAVDHFDDDYFGSAVNRSARIMSVAHGGQILLSQAMASSVGERLPASVTLRDLGLARLKDLETPERLYQLIHPKLRQEFPALRSLEATPNNLPQQLTPFIGRERELGELLQLLGNTRLVTVVGTGGIGKTRLSVQLAADAIDDYSDGVWLVELAPLADGRSVVRAVASVLGVQEEIGRPMAETLVKNLKDRQLLVLLDNCEHLLPACAEFAKRLLQSCSAVKIVATSREPLHLAGETCYQVPALTIPTLRTEIDPDQLTQYESVRLFVGRAGMAQPVFRLTGTNAAAVADICHRLDGLPLGIELAAARVRTLSVENIASRLSDRFDLLTRGDQTALPRQQTLRMSIDWSHDLLTESERIFFRRLSVFAGGWTLEAAEAVCTDSDTDRPRGIDLLTSLAEKSLVEVVADGDRYRLLETIREYARTRLRTSGEEEAIGMRHLAFYVALAVEAGRALYGPTQVAWLARLDLELENLLSAHRWCDGAKGSAELGLTLVASVFRYWVHRGPLELGHRITAEALARPGAQEASVARCHALIAATGLDHHMGRYDESHQQLQAGLALARTIGDTATLSRVLLALGLECIDVGDMATAQQHLEEALALSRQLDDRELLLKTVGNLAVFCASQGQLQPALRLFAEALPLSQEVGDREATAILLTNIVDISMQSGSIQDMHTTMLEAIMIAQETGSKRCETAVLEGSARLAAYLDDWARAGRLCVALESYGRATGLHDSARAIQRLVKRAREVLGPVVFAAVAEQGRALSAKNAIAETRLWLEAARDPRF